MLDSNEYYVYLALPGFNTMLRKIEIRDRVEKDLRKMPKTDADRILNAIYAMRAGVTGDVKKLTNHSPEYRLRIGNWRVLFDIDGDTIIVYRVLDRKDAYKG